MHDIKVNTSVVANKPLIGEALRLRKIELKRQFENIRAIDDLAVRAVTGMEWVRGLSSEDAFLFDQVQREEPENLLQPTTSQYAPEPEDVLFFNDGEG